jgi:hypothetical protein
MLPPKYLYQVTTERHANVCAVLFLIYISFHRRPPAIWIATNDNLQDWGGFTRVIARPREFILQPVETWERKGDVANGGLLGCQPRHSGDGLRLLWCGRSGDWPGNLCRGRASRVFSLWLTGSHFTNLACEGGNSHNLVDHCAGAHRKNCDVIDTTRGRLCPKFMNMRKEDGKNRDNISQQGKY